MSITPATAHPTEKPPEMRSRLENRFWSKVDFDVQRDQCWEWAACTFANGYGAFRFRGNATQAHRVAYYLYHDFDSIDDLPGQSIRHTCDNRVCCNPRHLIPGSQSENLIDASKRTRDLKLSVEDVKEIRARGPDESYSDLAEEFGVSKAHIGRVVNREAYAWVD